MPDSIYLVNRQSLALKAGEPKKVLLSRLVSLQSVQFSFDFAKIVRKKRQVKISLTAKNVHGEPVIGPVFFANNLMSRIFTLHTPVLEKDAKFSYIELVAEEDIAFILSIIELPPLPPETL
jgi:hypothetical protein